METKPDFSCGVVPVWREGDSWRVLLIEQHDKRGGTFWAFPKGHPEAGETTEEAALRELGEEVGLKDITLEAKKTFEQHYSFAWEGEQIDKTVLYFLGYVESGIGLSLQEKEIANAAWFSLSEAMDKLTHQNSKDVLIAVREFLTN